MAQLLRDNAADARVVDDLHTLAAAYDERGVEASAAAQREAQVDDLALLTEAFGAPRDTTPWWRDAGEQLLRYRAWVAFAVVVFAVLVFVSPAPKPLASDEDAGTALIPTSDAAHAAAVAGASDVAPTTTPEDPFDFSFAEPVPAFDDDFATTPATFDTTPQTYAPAPATLAITQSGYSSVFAGTPAEQAPPKNGLPVETVAGRVTQYSYIRLTGAGASLQLVSVDDPDAAMYSPTARVQLCHITTPNWKPERDAAPDDAPKYNAECLEGKAAKGTWTFTFSAVNNPVDPNGWAIVPITADNATFHVTFAPKAQ